MPDSLDLVLLRSNRLINDVVTKALDTAVPNHTFRRFCRQFGGPEPI